MSTREELERWLRERIGAACGVPYDEVDPEEDLEVFAVDSVHLVMIAYDLEEMCGRELPPTILLEYETIRKLATFLSQPAP